MVREDTWSFPNERAIAIRIASPKLASQAPRVKRIKMKKLFGWYAGDSCIVVRRIIERIIVSRVRRAIRRLVR